MLMWKWLLGSVILFLLTFVIYVNFFDILIPGLPNGSYRQAVGPLFAIPSFLLAGGQVLIGGLIIYFISSKFSPKAKLQKSLFISAAVTLFFSFTYVIFPFFGPFYYIVFAVGGPPHALLVEVVWSVIMLTAGTLLTEKLNKVERKYAFLVAAITIMFITVAAS